VAALLLAAKSPSARAQEPDSFTASSTYTYSFGQQISFSIEASAPAPITSLYLHTQVEDEIYSDPHAVAIEPGTAISATFSRDLNQSPFPPFAQIRWWWEVRDADGNSITTEPDVFQYTDNRFVWHTTTAGQLEIYTVVDDPVYVQSALNVAQTALGRIEQTLEAPPLDLVSIYIYPSIEDLRAALEMAGREWAGGQARPELGSILVAVPPDAQALARMERDIPHELTHLVVYQTVGPAGYRTIPAWLNEGLATANELRPDPMLASLLESAHVQGRLIPFSELCNPFPINRDAALLYYAQSGSLVSYIRERYGNVAIRSLLAAYADGAGCEGGITRALGLTSQQLELAWRGHLLGLSEWMTWLSENSPALILWGLSLLLALPMMGLFRRPDGDKE
jgi:hypothetical protein